MIRISIAHCFLFVGLLLPSSLPGQQQGPPAKVVAKPVVERELATGETFVATVKPIRKSTIGSAVDGRVEMFEVNEGDRVKKGDVLAKLRTGTLEIERDAALSELAARWAELSELVNGSRPEEIAEAKAMVGVAKAKLDFAKARRRRAEELFRRENSIPEEEFQLVVANALESEQMLQQAQATLALLEQGPRKEKIEQARAKFLVQVNMVNKLQDQIALHSIRAYYDGYITREHTEVGAWLLKGAPVVDVVRLDEVDLEVALPGRASANLSVGDSARVELTALPERSFVGKVALIVPEADTRTRTFPVKIRVKNTIEKGVPLLKANMFAQVTLPVGAKGKLLFVPKDAIVLGGPTPIVYVVDGVDGGKKTGTVRIVPVQLGVADGDSIQVRADLRAGQQVVTLGNERLRPGQKVMLIEAE